MEPGAATQLDETPRTPSGPGHTGPAPAAIGRPRTFTRERSPAGRSARPTPGRSTLPRIPDGSRGTRGVRSFGGQRCVARRAGPNSPSRGTATRGRPRAVQRRARDNSATGGRKSWQKEGPQHELRALEEPGDNLLSRIRTIIGGNCLTTVFGMGTGMASCLWSPGLTVAPRGHGTRP